MKNVLLQNNRKVLKDLHDTFKIDFQKEVTIKQVELPKTVNRIVSENQEINKNTLNILLIQRDDFKKGNFYVVTFDRCGKIDIEHKFHWYSVLDNYYRKLDFEKDRKNKELNCYLIVVNKDLLTSKTLSEREKAVEESWFNDANTRVNFSFNNEDIRKSYRSYGGAYTVDRLNNLKLNNLSISVDFNRYPHRLNEQKEASDLIDKSGYNVWTKRNNLENKACANRTHKNIVNLKNTNFTEETEKLQKLAQDIKTSIINRLDKANTYIEFREISRIAYTDYSWTLSSLQKHIDKIKSIKDNTENVYRYGAYNSINEVIDSIQYLTKEFNETKEKIETVLPNELIV